MNQEGRRERLQTLVTLIRQQQFPYQERPKPQRDWHQYDQAQIHEKNDALNLIRDLVDLAEQRLPRPPRTGRGRPPAPQGNMVKTLLAQTYLGDANRVASGLPLVFREKLQITSSFSYKTLERAYDNPGINRLLDQVFLLTNEPVRGLERVFSTDGTGFSTQVAAHYARDRERQRDRATTTDAWPAERGYVYNVAVVGVHYKVLAGWVSRAHGTEGEHSLFPECMRQLQAQAHVVDQVLGDGVFATRPCCEVVANLGAEPRFLPRRNVTFKSHGVAAWPRMLADLLDHPQAWLHDYHLRSNSETCFSVLNRESPQPLRKRLDARKETEAYLRAVMYNVKRLCYLSHLVGLHPLRPTMA